MTSKDTEKLLVVYGGKFTAGAVWERRDGIWRCKRAAPIVSWMLRVKHPSVVLDWLKAKGYRYEWRQASCTGWWWCQGGWLVSGVGE